MARKLRSGYTTGACAAAAAKAATALLVQPVEIATVTIPLPDGSRVEFTLEWQWCREGVAQAAVIKDAGDDPDVTNGALIVAEARFITDKSGRQDSRVIIRAGTGVGIVTKPGLTQPVGSPAINPVPLKMIEQAVSEALQNSQTGEKKSIEITIIVPDGEKIAEKTLNRRLGVIGGISILGTTGIVRPISAEAWTATIKASMNVAEAAGIRDIVVSTGRTSERCVQAILNSPEEGLVMMGDYLEFTLMEISRRSFRSVHMAAMWAKLLKGAMKIPQTHVRHGILATDEVLKFFAGLGVAENLLERLRGSNTAREILSRLQSSGDDSVIDFVCDKARQNYQAVAGVPVIIYLVDGTGRLLRRMP